MRYKGMALLLSCLLTGTVWAAPLPALEEVLPARQEEAQVLPDLTKKEISLPAAGEVRADAGLDDWLRERQFALFRTQDVQVFDAADNEPASVLMDALAHSAGAELRTVLREYVEGGVFPPFDDVVYGQWTDLLKSLRLYRLTWEDAAGYHGMDMAVVRIPLKELAAVSDRQAKAFWESAFQAKPSEAERRYLLSRPRTAAQFQEALAKAARVSVRERNQEFLREAVAFSRMKQKSGAEDTIVVANPVYRFTIVVDGAAPLRRYEHNGEVYYMQRTKLRELGDGVIPLEEVVHLWKEGEYLVAVYSFPDDANLYLPNDSFEVVTGEGK